MPDIDEARADYWAQHNADRDFEGLPWGDLQTSAQYLRMLCNYAEWTAPDKPAQQATDLPVTAEYESSLPRDPAHEVTVPIKALRVVLNFVGSSRGPGKGRHSDTEWERRAKDSIAFLALNYKVELMLVRKALRELLALDTPATQAKRLIVGVLLTNRMAGADADAEQIVETMMEPNFAIHAEQLASEMGSALLRDRYSIALEPATIQRRMQTIGYRGTPSHRVRKAVETLNRAAATT
jgi:hypothetical protein